MSWPATVGLMRRVSTGAAAIVLLSLPAAGDLAIPASAASFDGRYPSSVPGCSTNVRIGQVRSIYTSAKYYGWAEIRYGTAGTCRGYQWVRLHLRESITLACNPRLYPRHSDECWPQVRSDQQKSEGVDFTDKLSLNGYSTTYGYYVIGRRSGGTSYDADSAYDTKVIYTPGYKIVYELEGHDRAGNDLFFGHDYMKAHWQA